MLAEAGAATFPAIWTVLVMLAVPGAATFPAILAQLVMLAEAGAAAIPASGTTCAVRTFLVDAPLDWMRRRGIRRRRSCCGCLFHDVNGGGSEL